MIIDGLGFVETEYFEFDELKLENGEKLSPVRIAYETYGELNADRNNAILICHALSGDAHVAGWHRGDKYPGWWDGMVGPGRAFDTEKYFVISSNVIGGCKGSTGPSSINPVTGKPYGLEFPVVTIKDMVNAQKKLIDHLGVRQLLAVVGGSMGGMQVLQWAVSYKDLVKTAIPIATTAHLSPQGIAFNEVGRRAIMSDPDWNGGDYYGGRAPERGLALARMIGHITYLSDESMREKFGRELKNSERYGYDFSTEFQVESYLHHQGESFVKRFDANSYLYLTKAIDYFDLANGTTLFDAFKGVKARFLVISISSDWLYPPYQSREIVMALTANEIDVTHVEIKSGYGHDAFLLETGQLTHVITNSMQKQRVQDLMVEREPLVMHEKMQIKEAAKRMIEGEFTHLPISSRDGRLIGIITAWDIANAVANGYNLVEDVLTEEVVTAYSDELIGAAAKRMEKHNVSSLPVVTTDNRVVGIITSDCISRLIAGDERRNGNPET